MKIMVVDDAAFMRMMIVKALETLPGIQVKEAEDGQKAFELYKEFQPDITTMDITMPNVDGIEAVKLIRAHDPNARILMCSAMGQQAMVLEAIQAGAQGFIVKPFQPEKVLDEVKKLVK